MTEHRMDPDLKAKWVSALRSGEYRQGITSLYNETTDTFCCLGVLCAVAGIDQDDITNIGFMTKNQCMSLGIDVSDSVYWQLAEMNDFQRKSFREIADYIEAHL